MENFFFGTKYIWKNRVVKDYVLKKLQTPQTQQQQRQASAKTTSISKSKTKYVYE